MAAHLVSVMLGLMGLASVIGASEQSLDDFLERGPTHDIPDDALDELYDVVRKLIPDRDAPNSRGIDGRTAPRA